MRVFPNREDFLSGKVVTFDLFDTLIYRKTISHYQMWKNESYSYFLHRVKAEFVARVFKRIKGIPEISESDIYKRMPNRWRLEFEIQLESKNMMLNPVTTDFLRQSISNGKKVCVISDTHYREVTIKNLLRNLGLPEVKIFTSGEYGLTKSTGLFLKAQKYLGVAFQDWIHIGDNYHSDFLSPTKLGIKSYLYPSMKSHLINSGLISPRGYRFLKRSSRPGLESITRLFANLLFTISRSKSGSVEIPVVLGSVVNDLICTPIVEEIHSMYKDKNHNCILYSSRDGWLPYLAHRRLFPDDPVRYLKTSRRMLKDSKFIDYISSVIGNSEKIILFDLGWRGSTAEKISTHFSETRWDFVYWQFLGRKASNQFELNPGTVLNRIRVLRSRDFIETLFTDPSKGYDRIDFDLTPIESDDRFQHAFKELVFEGAKQVIDSNFKVKSRKTASVTLEAFCRFPSNRLIKLCEGHSHEINEKLSGSLIITSWRSLLRGSRVLWPYGSKLCSGSKINRSFFAAFIVGKELLQRIKYFVRR